MERKLLFSVTRKDLEMQTFSVGGHGGSGKDTSNSGCRLVHRPSGATGEGREHRSLTRNRIAAFERLVNSDKFKTWHRIECAQRMGQTTSETSEQVLARVDRMIEDGIRSGEIVIEELIVADPRMRGMFVTQLETATGNGRNIKKRDVGAPLIPAGDDLIVLDV